MDTQMRNTVPKSRSTHTTSALASKLRFTDVFVLTCAIAAIALLVASPFFIWQLLQGSSNVTIEGGSPEQETPSLASESADEASTSETPSTQNSPSAETESTSNAVVIQPRPENLSSLLPYRGLSEQWIDDTWLGRHDAYDPNPCNEYRREGTTRYFWTARNGTGDVVFTAYMRDGVVVDTRRDNGWTDYWPDIDGYPDLYASGRQNLPETRSAYPDEDPTDYLSPDDYADNAADWFADQGYNDPWAAAYEYWENNAG